MHRPASPSNNPGLLVGGGVVAAVAAVLFYLCCFVTVPKGHVGVVSTFGAVSDRTFDPGAHAVWPWQSIHRMNCQTQKDEEPANVPTANGLTVAMKATMLYRLRPERAAALAREVGHEGYQERVVSPYFRNVVRDVTAEFTPEALYTSERQKVESKVLERIRHELDRHGFEVEAVMILDPVLPDVVKARVEAKVAAEQDAARMEFVLKQKELEARAKVVEADGIAKAQKIIKADLDDNYLRYLWIMALKEHEGAVIYVPTGNDGLPFFRPVHPALPEPASHAPKK